VRGWDHAQTRQVPQEFRECAVRTVQDQRQEYASERAAITSIAGKLDVGTDALRL